MWVYVVMQMFSCSAVLQISRIVHVIITHFCFENHDIFSCFLALHLLIFLCHCNNMFQRFRQTDPRCCDYIRLIKLQAVCCSHILYTRCELTFVGFTKREKLTGISELKMSWIAVSISSCEALDQALNVQWNMNDLFPEDSLTSFGIWPEWHTVSIMKLNCLFFVRLLLHLCVYL